MPSKVLCQHDPFVMALMDALGLPKHTQSFELRCAVDEAATVRCAYFPQADGVEGFDPKPLLAQYKLVPANVATQGDPAEAFANEVAAGSSNPLVIKVSAKVRWWVRPFMLLLPWIARRAVKASVKG